MTIIKLLVFKKKKKKGGKGRGGDCQTGPLYVLLNAIVG